MAKDIFEKVFGERPATGYEFTHLEVEPFINERFSGFVIRWSAKGIGFGEVTFYTDKSDGQFKVDTECMDKIFLMALFHELIKRTPEA